MENLESNIWVVDFGSQYTQLIIRMLRELGHSSTWMTVAQCLEKFPRVIHTDQKPKALILSGGPQSIFEDKNSYELLFRHKDLPILGICYGMQLMAQTLGGQVARGEQGEYGKSVIVSEKNNNFFSSLNGSLTWMSHFDHVVKLPPHFEVRLKSQDGLIACMSHEKNPWVGMQFHPEVAHTVLGKTIFSYFLHDLSKLNPLINTSALLAETLKALDKEKNETILCAFSGGVDSLVAAILTQKVVGESLVCFFVDHGLLRLQDLEHIHLLQKQTQLKIVVVDAQQQFLSSLKGVSDPEQKRKKIGALFIEVFEQITQEYQQNNGIKFTRLLQGTLFPDVIESLSPHGSEGKSSVIKSHHNVGGLPEKMNLKLLEPLRLFFKDQVRAMGVDLGINPSWLNRHPFPGPGLGVRILGEITQEKLSRLKLADEILFQEMKNHHCYQDFWQSAAIYIPQKTVGVKGDERAYEEVICIRLVNSTDAMTATSSRPSWDFLELVSSRITNEVEGITRVVYDITSKPPGTIEWE